MTVFVIVIPLLDKGICLWDENKTDDGRLNYFIAT